VSASEKVSLLLPALLITGSVISTATGVSASGIGLDGSRFASTATQRSQPPSSLRGTLGAVAIAGLMMFRGGNGVYDSSNQSLRIAPPPSREHGSLTFRRFLRYAAET
jgi:hypothetical protein